MTLGDLKWRIQPGDTGNVNAALGLHCFDDDRRRQIKAAAGVVGHRFEIVERVIVRPDLASEG